jgi:hypothetical protein
MMTLDDGGAEVETIAIRFDDGETVMRALEEYRGKQIESASAPGQQKAIADAFRQAAEDTARLMKEIEAQL